MILNKMYCANHNEQATCLCGKNTYCSSCGFGQGSIPCDCDTGRDQTWEEHKKLLKESLKKHAHLWKALAKL